MMTPGLLPVRLPPGPRGVPRAGRRRGGDRAHPRPLAPRRVPRASRCRWRGPSLVAGVALAMMEALADFGTVATFGYRTLTEAIYRVWYGMFDRIAATQLAERAAALRPGAAPARAPLARPGAVRPERPGGPRAGAGAARGLARRRPPPRRALAVLASAFLLPVGQLAVVGDRARCATGRVAPDFPALLGNRAARGRAAAAARCALRRAPGLRGPAPPHPRGPARGPVRVHGLRAARRGHRGGVLLPLAWVDHALAPRSSASSVDRSACSSPARRPGSSSPTSSASSRWDCSRWRRASAGSLRASTTRRGRSGPAAGAALRRVHLPLIRGGLLTALVAGRSSRP